MAKAAPLIYAWVEMDLPAVNGTGKQCDQIQKLVSQDNGPDIPWMLSHGIKGKGCQNYPQGRPGKTGAFRNIGNDLYI